MNIRKLIKFLFTTFIIGGAVGLISSFILRWDTYAEHLNPFNGVELLGLMIFFAGLGFTFSVISMTGYFAYLYIHRFGLSLFRSYWPIVQILVIAFVFFDLVYFPYRASDDVAIYWYILGTTLFLAVSWIVAKVKAKETNQSGFIPALFFMFVMTTIEWIPAMLVESSAYLWIMLIPLLACNIYQIIGSHRIANRVDGKSAKDPARKDYVPAQDKKQKQKQKKKGKNAKTVEA